MAVNYDDERFTEVEAEEQQALSEVEQTYGGMVSESDKYYQDQIDASKEWADKQTQLQQEQTDFTIEQIEQQKEQAQKDYTKEQSGAYVDWQKQSNQYGANAEQMAAAGMTGTGYSESSKVSMYNTYQNRVATAREAFTQATLAYDNAIKEARLQNNSALAEIAYNAYVRQLELSLQGFQYKNQLVLDQMDKKMQVKNTYHGHYQDVLAQINQENALAEQIRQYNKSLAEDQRQYNLSYGLQQEQLKEEQRQHDTSLEEEKRQYDQNYLLQLAKLEDEQNGGLIDKDPLAGLTAEQKLAMLQAVNTVPLIGNSPVADMLGSYITATTEETELNAVTVKNNYMQMKKEGASQRELDATLKEAVRLKLITQDQATEIRESR